MGRIYVELDPEGYQHATEPGFMMIWDGPSLQRAWQPTGKRSLQRKPAFYNPPGSEWLMPLPRQFSADWYKDDRLSEHVLTEDLWTFAPGVNHEPFEITAEPGEPGHPDNKWMTLTTPATLSPLDLTDFEALGEAAGVTLPEDMATIAFVDRAPVSGVHFSQENSFAPHFQYLALPEPNDLIVFGWAEYAAIVNRSEVVLLRTPQNDKQTWESLGRFSFAKEDKGEPRSGSMLVASQVDGQARVFTALPVGFRDLWMALATSIAVGDSKGVRLAEEDLTTHFKAGAWWVAAAPKQRISLQVQVVGFEEADTSLTINFPEPVTLFDLGAEYKPTIDPVFGFHGLIHRDPKAAVPVADFSTVGLANWDSPTTGEHVTLTLIGDDGIHWSSSDGTRQAGGWDISLRPGNSNAATEGAYLAPQIRIIELKFPVKLEDRECNPLLLDDTQFHAVACETSLREPDGKRIEVDLYDDGVETITTSGHDLRDYYPVHILEDVDGDNIPDTLRAAGWIIEPDLELVKDRTSGAAFNLHRLTGKGLLTRVDTDWPYLPQLCDPQGVDAGKITHVYAVRATLEQKGIDPDDTDQFVAQEDPLISETAGETSVVAHLPGTWGLQPGIQGKVVDSPFAPRWNQTALDYCDYIARRFRGWRIYETLARVIRYHADLLIDLQLGFPYWSTATIYRTKAEAVAAGTPKQYGLALNPRRSQIRPKGNLVRVTGEDPGDSLAPHVIDRAPETVTDADDENFLGEYVTVPLELTLAVDRRTMGQLARVRLLTAKRRSHLWQVPVALPPWRMSPGPVDVGRVVTLAGRGPHLVTHLRWQGVKSDASINLDYHVTTLTCEKLPASAAAGAGAGSYPGRGEAEDS